MAPNSALQRTWLSFSSSIVVGVRWVGFGCVLGGPRATPLNASVGRGALDVASTLE
jgi:hypothetical protein